MRLRHALPLLILCPAIWAADDTPPWLRSAAAEKLPTYDSKVPAVVLVDESSVSIDDTGRILTTDHYAVRVLNRAGMGAASAYKHYLRDTDKVRDLKAWVITPAGESHRVGKEKIIDLGVGDDALYEDVRARVVSAEKECDPGAVFGYESVVEQKSVFTSMGWEFGGRLPTRVSRFSLTVPSGWSATAVTLNKSGVSPVESRTTRTWEVHDLPFFEGEPLGPSFSSLRPRLTLSIFPPVEAKTRLGPSFADWSDVAKYANALHDPQAEPDAAITAKVKELTAGSASEADKIRALASYVQQIRYVSIQTGLGRGGGYKPHTAAMVFAKSYGDCKDKATLLRAMLRAAGIESWPVLIFSGDPLYVRAEWPSPQQFNHCIIAIAAPADMTGDAVMQDPNLGKLLIFDPTDEYTTVGHIPVDEQNSLALIAAGAKGALVRMPAAQPLANTTVRKIEAAISADGSVKGTMLEELSGWTAVIQRASRKEGGEKEYAKRVERRITDRLRSASISDLKTQDLPGEGAFRIELGFASPGYAQLMQKRLMVFRPSVLEPVDPLPFAEAKRTLPAVLRARNWSDTVTVKLPEGFDPDELPDAATFETPFGRYQSKVSIEKGVLTFTRTLTVKSMVVPPEDYPKLREFAGRVAGADQAPVVLARK